MKKRIHILGASGSGTTTLAGILCEKLNYTHLDTDDFFWQATEPPYSIKRTIEERQLLLQNEIEKTEKWIISGSLCGWGDIFVPHFDLVIFLYLDKDIRLERIKKRERMRYGNRIDIGGDMHEENVEFIKWTAQYDDSTEVSRNIFMHEVWLKQIQIPVVRLSNQGELAETVNLALKAIKS